MTTPQMFVCYALPPPGASAPYVATRTALKALDTTCHAVTYLTESGREGVFVWRAGNYAARIAADTLEGVFVKADAIAASSGAWVRQYDGALQVEWFGAVANSATDSRPAFAAALTLLDVIDTSTEGNMGSVEGMKGFYTLGSSLELPAPVRLLVPGYLRYTPDSGSAVIVGSVTPAVAARNTGYDIDIGGLRAMDGWTSTPTETVADGCNGFEIRCAQFSNFRVGRIIGFNRYGVWGNQTNSNFSGQHCQDNTMHFGDIAFCGTGMHFDSFSGVTASFQVNEVHVQNCFANWIGFVCGHTTHIDASNNHFHFSAMDADAGGGMGYIGGGWNTFYFGYSGGNNTFYLTGSAQYNIFHGHKITVVDNTTAGGGMNRWFDNQFGQRNVTTYAVKKTGMAAMVMQDFYYDDTVAPAANNRGAQTNWSIKDAGGTKRLAAWHRVDHPAVAAGAVHARHVWGNSLNGVDTQTMALWQGISLGAATDQGVGTINTPGRHYQDAHPIPYRLSGAKAHDLGSLADGARETTTVTVTGAALGDVAQATMNVNTAGLIITAWVSAADTVTVNFQNGTGSTIDITSATLKAWVSK